MQGAIQPTYQEQEGHQGSLAHGAGTEREWALTLPCSDLG